MKGKPPGHQIAKDSAKENTNSRALVQKGKQNLTKPKSELSQIDIRPEVSEGSASHQPLQPKVLSIGDTRKSPKIGQRKGRLEPLSKTQVQTLTQLPTSKPQDKILMVQQRNLPKISQSSLQKPSQAIKGASNSEPFARTLSLNQKVTSLPHPRTAEARKTTGLETKKKKITEINEEDDDESDEKEEPITDPIVKKPAKKPIIGKNAPSFEEWKRRNGYAANQKVILLLLGLYYLEWIA